ncbi:uncharacterized protein LOC142981257 [Anticarsia gemmatalis]|uniref:uncharacterized protein LOC142981257 n=1 Tax=Anticarsia gemmatalis TaxID=129554 RepID=UPI003F77411F
MTSVTLYDEYRLIERTEIGINRAWQGAHLLLFFLAFVFGSFCTFCFHMLMYLFDEKCVLFPKLLSLTSMRHNVIYEFIPTNKDLSDLPVDFLSTQWVEKSTCALPTYVPLISGIFGLVWTTMFLMCSTGSRTLTGLQRPWRVLPPVFLFSVAMSGLCIYSSAVTHYGLQELCIKLGEITGSSTCTYTVNVATLTYERRIRGVYQATRLTITSAWLHTACWLVSALLAVVRVLLAVDFQLVRVRAGLRGDVDKIMEKNETQIRTISPDDLWVNTDYYTSSSDTDDVQFPVKRGAPSTMTDEITTLHIKGSHMLFSDESHFTLVPAERQKLERIAAYNRVSPDNKFIVKIIFDLIDHLDLQDVSSPALSPPESSSTVSRDSQPIEIVRQYGRQKIEISPKDVSSDTYTTDSADVANEMVREIRKRLYKMLMQLPIPATPSRSMTVNNPSVDNITDEMREIIERRRKASRASTSSDQPTERSKRVSNIKHASAQTEAGKKTARKSGKSVEKHVIISERNSSPEDDETDRSSKNKKMEADKETQTDRKEKQD